MQNAAWDGRGSRPRRWRVSDAVAARIPGVPALAGAVARIARVRLGRVPVGLIGLLPAAVLLDILDAADELVLGPVGMALSFVAETAFVLGVTGRASWALGAAGFDLIPGVDVVPMATIAVASRIVEEWREGAPDAGFQPTGPVIDV